MRKPPKGKSLAEVNPELAKEWHPTKNGDSTPFDFASGSNKKVWWKCHKGADHEWEAIIASRNDGRNCPFCAGRRPTKHNNLESVNPELAKEWHPYKNTPLKPKDFLPASGKKVWWKCPRGDDHEWEASISNRSKGSGCPICSGYKTVNSTTLSARNPELAKEWHPTKNGLASPSKVYYKARTKYWWKCPKGDDHEWEASVEKRSTGTGCPYCAGQRVSERTSLAFLNPELAKEWHPTKNGEINSENFTTSSNRIVWWKCPKGDDHEWRATINSRNLGRGCPFCDGKKISKDNNLQSINSTLAQEWHPTKNGKLTPKDVTPFSTKKVWWKCPKGDDHEWESRIHLRSNGRGCAVCAGRKAVISNCLATLKPKIAKEWHPTKNKDLTPLDVTLKSNIKVWWQCSKNDDHIWESRVANRSGGNDCPFCTLTPQSRQELLITFELKQFFDIDPKGFKTKINGKLWTIDIYLEELNLGIEFDGSHWHKDKRSLDKLKTEKLHEEGFTIMRIREEPLKPITDIDVVSKRPFNGKKVTNDILKHILEVYEIDVKRVNKMKEYFRKRKLQNEEALDVYIDQILEEKAERKRKKK